MENLVPDKVFDDHESFLKDLEEISDLSTNSEIYQLRILGSEIAHGDHPDDLNDDDAQEHDEEDQQTAATLPNAGPAQNGTGFPTVEL